MNFVNVLLKNNTLETFKTVYAEVVLERNTTMIHTLQQSVTCTCIRKHYWLMTYLLASHMFKVKSLNITRTYLKQLLFTLVNIV